MALLLVTHGGTFHLDDVFAYATLKLALASDRTFAGHTLVRTRDEGMMTHARIVWDVGGVYDAARNRFDHHQRDAPRRDDGVAFSAAGLIWRKYGEAATRRALLDRVSPAEAAAIADEIDAEVVRRIDEIDNGVGSAPDLLGLSNLVADLNPAWDSTGDTEATAADAAFHDAAELVSGFLVRRAEAMRARRSAERVVLDAHAASAEPAVLELPLRVPWKRAVFAHRLPTVFAIYPAVEGGWVAEAAPVSLGSFQPRCPFPAEWAGLRGQEAAHVTGIADAVFVHVQRFIAVAGSRDGAHRLSRRALDLSSAHAVDQLRPCPR